MKEHRVIPAIMIGGSGTRLWPLSRVNKPKQFLCLDSANSSSFFQQALERFSTPQYGLPWLMSAGETLIHAKEQVRQREFSVGGLLVEPSMQGTAAAIAALTVAISKMDPAGLDAILLVAPSDHLIKDPNRFSAQVARGFSLALEQDRIVTFGITPEHPETGFGYIRPGDPILSDGVVCGYRIRQGDFLEKPSLENAKRYVEDGYCWNAGIFMFRAGVMMQELARHAPATLLAAQNAVQLARVTNQDSYPSIWLDEASFRTAPADVPIDTAVMERTSCGAVVPCAGIGWSDIGSLSSLYEATASKDEQGNALSGPVIALETTNTLAFARNDRKVVLIGLDNMIIVDDDDALLIAPMDKAQKVKDAVGHLKRHQQPETHATKTQLFGWGRVALVSWLGQTVVFTISLQPGMSIALRAPATSWENWVVTAGEIAVLQNGSVHDMAPSDSLSPARDQIASLHNHSPATAAIMVVRHYDAAGMAHVTAADLLQLVSYEEPEQGVNFVPMSVTMMREDETNRTN